MSSGRTLPGLLLALAIGCGADAGASSPRLSRQSAVPADLPAPLQFEAGRNFLAEYEDFHRMVNEQHADPAEIRAALGVAATRQFTYTNAAGAQVCGWEFELQGPQPEAPFYEAFAAGYPGQSFFVFFEKSWFRWRSVECGFQQAGAFGETAPEP